MTCRSEEKAMLTYRIRLWLRRVLGLLVFGVSVTLLVRLSTRLDLSTLAGYIERIPGWRLSGAMVLTLVNFAQLTFYDRIGLAYLGSTLPTLRVGVASFIATAVAHNVGPSLALGGSVRYRFYSEWGLNLSQIATLISLGMLTFWVGFAAVAGLALVTVDAESAVKLRLPREFLCGVGLVLLGLLLGYGLFCWLGPRKIRVYRWHLRVPTIGQALAQCLVAATDWLAMAWILFLLLPEGAMPFFVLLRLLIVVQLTAMASQLPGGLGLFESLMTAALTPTLPESTVLAALLSYRVVYLVVPLVLAMFALAFAEGWLLRRPRAGLEGNAEGVN
jgi:uncharacterized membrane protein YbhN (UPF0104 family)